jgi:single-strand selective monofunctional uracil DNA glycosylase
VARERFNVSPSSKKLIKVAKKLCDEVGRLTFGAPVTHVYNPLTYAWRPHTEYLRKFGAGPKQVIFLGMNPGPFGMVQTGIPFGEISVVRDWLQIQGPVGKPPNEHPRRVVSGFACQRSEVSGQRLWGLFAERFGEPEKFFERNIVMNYCPLAFLESTGRNRTPDKLAPAERAALLAVCDEHLRQVIKILQPEWVIGVGDFAAKRATAVLSGDELKIGRILHPSPASPAANRDWSALASGQLRSLGLWT